MRIGEVLKGWRHSNQLTIEQAAKAIGLPWDTYRRVEQGGAMRPGTFTRIIEWLFSR